MSLGLYRSSCLEPGSLLGAMRSGDSFYCLRNATVKYHPPRNKSADSNTSFDRHTGLWLEGSESCNGVLVSPLSLDVLLASCLVVRFRVAKFVCGGLLEAG